MEAEACFVQTRNGVHFARDRELGTESLLCPGAPLDPAQFHQVLKNLHDLCNCKERQVFQLGEKHDVGGLWKGVTVSGINHPILLVLNDRNPTEVATSIGK